MPFNPDTITQERLHELRRAAEHAWSDETRHEDSKGHPQPSAGQCYVTSQWLVGKLGGGHVGVKQGHYFWVSPDKNYIVDLTGDQDSYSPVKSAGQQQDGEDEPWTPESEQMRHRPGPIIYTQAKNPLYKGFRVKAYANANPRADLFAERANAALEGTLTKTAESGGSGSDAYPGEGPQAEEEFNQRYFHDPMIDDLNLSMEEPIEHDYKFVFGNGEFKVSPIGEHEQMAGEVGMGPEHTGPMAFGHINVRGRDALWSVESNIGLRGLVKMMKDYSKQAGWDWGGLVDGSGQPVSEEFAGKKSYWYGWRAGKLLFSERPFWPHRGRVDVISKVAYVTPIPNPFAREGLEEWAHDFGFRFAEYPGGYTENMDRFWEKVNKMGPIPQHRPELGRCWEWTAAKHYGYGSFQIGTNKASKTIGAHRYSYALARGAIPEDMSVLHECDNPACVRPDHLFLGTLDDNNWDMRQKGRGVNPPKMDGEQNPSAKLTATQVEEIRQKYAAQEGSQRVLAKAYGVSQSTVGKIVNNRLWASYPGGTDMNDRVKNKEWPTTYDKGDPEADPGRAFEGEPQGALTCPYCDETLPDFKAYVMHTQDHQDSKAQPIDDGHFPTIEDMDTPLPLRPRNVNPTAIPVTGSFADTWTFDYEDPHWDFRVGAGGKEGKDLLQAPIPFIYDIEKDYITVGHPGMQTHEVMGQFTPGGIVEGLYEPKGVMVINTTTTIPFSTYHMMQLWYYSHPGLEITKFEMEDQSGNKHKIASTDVGSYIKSLTAADGAAWNASQALKGAGGKVYVVGGAVRDALLQKEPKDIDLMVSGLPPEDVNNILEHLPGRVDLTGKRFGVYRYHTKGQEVEIALPRTDTYEAGGTRGRGQITVDHHLPVEKDLQRRDFTANSMAVDLDSGQLIDPYQGARDIAANVLRTTHPNAFDEDPTRLVRALNMHSRHGLIPDEQTRKEMEEHAHRLDHESPDALGQQLGKFLEGGNPASGIRLAQETGVLKHLFPELANNFDYDQKNPHHSYTLGQHSLNVLSNIAQATKDPDLRLAALLHDTGKPASAWEDPTTGITHYYAGMLNGVPMGADHNKVGADLTEARLRQTFNYPASKIRNIHNLINLHMFPAFSSPKGARKFLNKTGDAADDLLTLRHADMTGKGQTPEEVAERTSVERMRGLVEQQREQGAPTTQSAISVNGNDLLNLGLKPGPQVGTILRQLTNDVVADPALNARDALLQRAQEYINAQPEA